MSDNLKELTCNKCGWAASLFFYNGCMGYEAIVCRHCDEEYTNENPLK